MVYHTSYTRCPALLGVLLKILQKVWQGDFPSQFASAFMILIPKSDDLSKPDQFRNIALTNTDGKLFFSILSSRLVSFMLENSYINRSIQKGFMSKVAGCVEHTALLHSALKNAKRHGRQIVVSWIDLQNAYG